MSQECERQTAETGFRGKLAEALSRFGLDGRRLMLGVSGGPDSVAMLRGVLSLREDMRLDIYAAHLDHQLRGIDSASDRDWLESLCRRLQVPLTIATDDVRAFAASQQIGLEEAGRRARYAFLERAAAEQGCSHLLLAHTADDQAETVLHHLLRGTGLAGLRGIPPARRLDSGVLICRPLHGFTREEIEGYLSDIGQDFRVDSTNRDPSMTRNRIRHVLLPLLRREFNPQVDEALRRLSQQADEIQSVLEGVADALLSQSLVDQNPDVCRVNVEPLAGQPRHLVRECLSRLWIRQDWPRQHMGFAEWERLAELVTGEGTAMLPGSIEAARRGSLLIVRRLEP